MNGRPATRQDGDPLWYKDAIFYELHAKAFRYANGDGMGALPKYPSPFRDDGYDISARPEPR